MAGYKVFVGGIPDEASDADLFDYFSQFGELSDYVVMKRYFRLFHSWHARLRSRTHANPPACASWGWGGQRMDDLH